MIPQLEDGLQRLAEVILCDLGIAVAELPGAGAAGGFGAGAVAFLGARLRPGFRAVAETLGLVDALRGVDWVVTGEGRLDAQSLQGKVVSGICRLAAKSGAKVAVLAGLVALNEDDLAQAGISAALQTAPPQAPLADAMADAKSHLTAAARQLAMRMRDDEG
jgi:glycerate kinase